MKFLHKYGIYLVVLIAFILRTIYISQSLWLDEAISALAARNYSFAGIIFEFLKGDNHPPLFYLILRAWGLAFGFSDISLRLLPILFGVGTVVVTYLFLKRLFEEKVALMGSFLLAISPLHIYYSQEIRMYPLLGFWAVCLMYIFTYLLEKPKLWQWILFTFLLIIFVATDYVALFLLPAFFIIGKLKKINLVQLISSFIPLSVVAILWIPFFVSQIETARQQLSALPGWRDLAGGATVKEVVVLWMKFVLGRISFYPKIVYYLLVGFFSIPIMGSFYMAVRKYRKSYWLWIFFLTPLVGSFVISVMVPAFNYFRFIYVLPAFYGLISYGIYQLNNKRIKYFIAGLIILGNLLGTSFYFLDHNNQRENWKQAIAHMESKNPQLAIFEFPEPFAPYYWYSTNKIEGFGALNSLTSDKLLTDQKMINKIGSDTNKVVYFSYLRDLTDPNKNVEQKLQNLGFKPTQINGFTGIGEVVEYER